MLRAISPGTPSSTPYLTSHFHCLPQFRSFRLSQDTHLRPNISSCFLLLIISTILSPYFLPYSFGFLLLVRSFARYSCLVIGPAFSSMPLDTSIFGSMRFFWWSSKICGLLISHKILHPMLRFYLLNQNCCGSVTLLCNSPNFCCVANVGQSLQQCPILI